MGRQKPPPPVTVDMQPLFVEDQVSYGNGRRIAVTLRPVDVDEAVTPVPVAVRCIPAPRSAS